MAETSYTHSALLVFLILLISIHHSVQLQSSQAQTLLRIQALLNFPSVLNSWNNQTDFCNIEPSSKLTVVCYEESITQLHIIGEKRVLPLPQNFSIDSFFTTLVRLPDLKVITLVSLGLWGELPAKISRISSLEILNITSNFFHGSIPMEISSLTSLQTLILNDNMFAGELPESIGSLSILSVLSLNKNSLNGSLPDLLGSLDNLRVLSLSHNRFSGEVPDLSGLTNLQVLDLEDNSFGPQFPSVGSKIITLILRKNKFNSGIPEKVNSFHQLQLLDLSFNRFVGPFLTSLLSLPSIVYLNIEGNRFTGMLFENLACNNELEYVDLSVNLLTGKLPTCLVSDLEKRVVIYGRNCLSVGDDESQRPFSFCRNEALAVGILPHHRRRRFGSKVVVGLSVGFGVVGVILVVGLMFLGARRVRWRTTAKSITTRSISENASLGYPSKLLSDARYITQAMKLGALCLPPYKTFSLEELEEATNNFDTSSFMGEGSHGQMYRGQLKEGSLVAIRCLKLKKGQTIQSFMNHIELISKLRHYHLVSALGHCFDCCFDDSSVSRIFIVFEYVPNGTLRNWVSARRSRRKLTWMQRITAAIGVAKGIQFLHTGIVPGVFSNNLKITDILLDQNLVAKISSYNLPLLSENMVCTKKSSSVHQEKFDIYDFGVILLEIIIGRPLNSKNEVDVVKDQLETGVAGGDRARRRMVDPMVENAYSNESMKTTMEICCRCLVEDPGDRPSIEDVLWNLQFAAQVQDGWRGDSRSGDGSPVSPAGTPARQLIVM